MKYLKSFKIYESKDLIQEDLKSDIENILVDLIDDKNRINVAFFNGMFEGNDTLDIGIYYDNMYNDGLDISKYENNISQLLSYLEGEDYDFTSLHIDSDNEDYEIVCPKCGSLDIEYGEEDWYNNGTIMNTCNDCNHRDTEEEFEVKRGKNNYETIEEAKEFFSKSNGYVINSTYFEFIKNKKQEV